MQNTAEHISVSTDVVLAPSTSYFEEKEMIHTYDYIIIHGLRAFHFHLFVKWELWELRNSF